MEEAERERIWAIVETHEAGLSIRQIAFATGLSPSRVHQLLGSAEAREIPRWLSQQRGNANSSGVDGAGGEGARPGTATLELQGELQLLLEFAEKLRESSGEKREWLRNIVLWGIANDEAGNRPHRVEILGPGNADPSPSHC